MKTSKRSKCPPRPDASEQPDGRDPAEATPAVRHLTKLSIEWIPIALVRVFNPRSRNRLKFEEIVASIEHVGLKKPITITVSPREKDGEKWYATACGEGRLKACKVLGQTHIPAFVIEATDEELLLISLAENLARRLGPAVEHMEEIAYLKGQGYTTAEIAQKTNLAESWVAGILRLLEKGEERLVQAVVRRQLPLTVAIVIAADDDQAVQKALAEAYEDKSLRGNRLLQVRRLIAARRLQGKSLWGPRKARTEGPKGQDLLKVYQEETLRQRAVIRKAKLAETQLLFAVTALRTLLSDENFVTLLRAERLDTLPQFLSDRVAGKEV